MWNSPSVKLYNIHGTKLFILQDQQELLNVTVKTLKLNNFFRVKTVF